jgi:polyphosphate glucokinase
MQRDSARLQRSRRTRSTGIRTLGIDIGGSGIKAAVLDGSGRMLTERLRVTTPHPSPPDMLLKRVVELVAPLPAFQRISIGFPGVIRAGRVLTAPNLGTPAWRGFPLEGKIARLFGRPARLMNDAEVQGLGIVKGRGLEVVLTLGTGVGSAIFDNGRPAPHLELAHHPLHNGKTYDEYLGNAARLAHGRKKWNRRVRKAIGIVATLLNYDVLYLGGGNAGHIDFDLPKGVRIASNDTGITGGIHLWDDGIWKAITQGAR